MNLISNYILFDGYTILLLHYLLFWLTSSRSVCCYIFKPYPSAQRNEIFFQPAVVKINMELLLISIEIKTALFFFCIS